MVIIKSRPILVGVITGFKFSTDSKPPYSMPLLSDGVHGILVCDYSKQLQKD